MKKVSIIVLTYNNCQETTVPCLDSLINYCDQNEVEVIAVDNASSDNTREVLTEYNQKYPEFIKIILNDDNHGYAKGNNIGIEQASGDFVILLNNDTAVTENWLTTLLRPFSIDPTIGLVGPISNSVGNEQMLFGPEVNLDNYEEFAKSYTSKRKNQFFYSKNLGFFCVAISRDAINKIGVLDPEYGIGMFEDTDYCARATNAGIKLAISEDTFVFHSGSYSFSKLSNSEYQKLFNRNRAYFLSKNNMEWGIAQNAIAFWDKMKIDLDSLSKQYEKEGKDLPAQLEDIRRRTLSLTTLLDMLHRAEQFAENLNYAKVLNNQE